MPAFDPSAQRDDLVVELDARFRRPLLAFFCRRTSNAAEAEDLTQEVFLRILRHRDAIEPTNVEALVFTVATNLLRDRARRRMVRGDIVTLPDDGNPAAQDRNLVEVLDPSRVLAGKEDLDRVMAALSRLLERTRDIFILQRIEGMKNREIAEALGISVSAVEKHMVKALVHLTRALPAR